MLVINHIYAIEGKKVHFPFYLSINKVYACEKEVTNYNINLTLTNLLPAMVITVYLLTPRVKIQNTTA